MSVVAVAAYLRALIKYQGRTILAVTQAAGVHPNYISRLEQEKIKDPAARTLAALVREVGGNLEDAVDLLLADEATFKDGEARAERWLQQQGEAHIDPYVQAMSAYDAEQYIALVDTILNDPRRFRVFLRMALSHLLEALPDPAPSEDPRARRSPTSASDPDADAK